MPPAATLSTPASSAYSSVQPTPTPSGPSTEADSPHVPARDGAALQDRPELNLPGSAVGEASGAVDTTAPPADPDAPASAVSTDPTAPVPPEKYTPSDKRLRALPNGEFKIISVKELEALKKKAEPVYWCPPDGFTFFNLPAELRIQILRHHLCMDDTIDLHPDNHRTITPRLAIFRASKRMHSEASQIFYGQNTFRLFPTYPNRFFHTKRVLLSRIKPKYRALITTIELRLGPGWSKVPAGWHLTPKIGLSDCENLRLLKVFVQIDPSTDVFRGFRQSVDYYTQYSQDIILGLFHEVPTLKAVEFDAWTGVEKSGELMTALIGAVQAGGMIIGWGPERGWRQERDIAKLSEVDRLVQQLGDLSIKSSL